MNLQRQRTFCRNRCCASVGGCKRLLLRAAVAGARRLWVRGGQLSVLLLLCGLKTPPASTAAAIKIDFDLMPGSFDDQYQGCSQQVMEELNQGDYFTKELDAHKNYSRVWHKAHLMWLNQIRGIPKNMTATHAVAMLVYTLNDNVRSDLSRAMANAARTPKQYKDAFHFKYLHYYLTSAVQLLREASVPRNGSLCVEVHHGVKDALLGANVGATVRFGQFLSASLLREEAEKSGSRTLFTILTCLGTPVQDFSLKKEVLVPPYELFKVVNASHHPQGHWLQLRSAGNVSNYNCQLLKASSKKYIPAPTVIISLSFLVSIVISSKSRVERNLVTPF